MHFSWSYCHAVWLAIGMILSSVRLWCYALWLNVAAYGKSVRTSELESFSRKTTLQLSSPYTGPRYPVPSNYPPPKFYFFVVCPCLDYSTIFFTLLWTSESFHIEAIINKRVVHSTIGFLSNSWVFCVLSENECSPSVGTFLYIFSNKAHILLLLLLLLNEDYYSGIESKDR